MAKQRAEGYGHGDSNYEDTGCYYRGKLIPKCLGCPLRKCKYDLHNQDIKERRMEVRRYFRTGMPVRDIAARISCSDHTVLNDLRALKLTVKSRALKRRQLVVKLKSEGATVRQISEQLAVTMPTICSDIRALEVK